MDNTFTIAVDWEAEFNRVKAECEELQATIKNLKMENAELTAHLDIVQRDAKYTVGLVDGLKFAIRCNGVSGAEVKEA